MASLAENSDIIGHRDPSSSDFVKKIAFKSMVVSDLRFENQTHETIVGAHSNIYGRLTLKIQPKGLCHSLRQVVVGIKEVGPKELLFSERKIIGKRLEGYLSVDQNLKIYETYTDFDKEFKIQAPSKLGLYELEVCLIELEGVAVEKPGALNGFYKISSFDLEKLESSQALEYLWNLSEKNCKISLGLIRVI